MRKAGALLIALGLLLILGAAGLTGYNVYTEYKAGIASERAVSELKNIIDERSAQGSEGKAAGSNEEEAGSGSGVSSQGGAAVNSGEAAGAEADGSSASDGKSSSEIYEEYVSEITDRQNDPDMGIRAADVGGIEMIGILEIPYLGLSLPVAGDWSYPMLKKCPCRYSGSPYDGGFVIAGHNYRTHFGGLGSLPIGSEVIFTDIDGERFEYDTADVETLQPGDIEEMNSSDYELTLFTCTLGGATRVTVRCVRRN